MSSWTPGIPPRTRPCCARRRRRAPCYAARTPSRSTATADSLPPGAGRTEPCSPRSYHTRPDRRAIPGQRRFDNQPLRQYLGVSALAELVAGHLARLLRCSFILATLEEGREPHRFPPLNL
ncbi:hypothetical protein ACFQX6_12050 [Streptosporangium lutulentum]